MNGSKCDELHATKKKQYRAITATESACLALVDVPLFARFATKTIHAPYCQGNLVVLGGNAERQFVAMRLYALIYSTINKEGLLQSMIWLK